MLLQVNPTINLEDFIWNYQGDGSVQATVDVPGGNIISNANYEVAVFFSGLDSDAQGFGLELYENTTFVNSIEKTLTIHFFPRDTFYESCKVFRCIVMEDNSHSDLRSAS